MAETTNDKSSTRRTFLRNSVAGMAALGAMTIPRSVHADGDGGDALKIGLIGCGNRGRGAVIDALRADPRTILYSVGDVFADRAADSLRVLRRGSDGLREDEQIGDGGSRVQVTPDRVFPTSGHDLDSYRHVIDSGVDVVILATPPHFRPSHLEYAVSKGKHCFVEKPVGVDVPGAKRVAATCEVARTKGLSIVSGLIWRYDQGVREAMQKISDGAIGDVVSIESTYNSGSLWHRGDKPEWSRLEYQLRNWYYHNWLSGDHIVEQGIHSLDKTAWAVGDQHPLSAFGTGGRQQRIESRYGNIFDHHAVFYRYENEVPVYFMCRQQDGTRPRVRDIVRGTKGRAEIGENRQRIVGETKWRFRGPRKSMFVAEHEALFRSIREGKAINDGKFAANSTLISIMGRMASYTGQEITWDMVMATNDHLGPSEYVWGDVALEPVAIPGVNVPESLRQSVG